MIDFKKDEKNMILINKVIKILYRKGVITKADLDNEAEKRHIIDTSEVI